jgi:hypothetical protein
MSENFTKNTNRSCDVSFSFYIDFLCFKFYCVSGFGFLSEGGGGGGGGGLGLVAGPGINPVGVYLT